MSYSFLSIPLFDKQAKRLAKKYPSLSVDLSLFIADIEPDPLSGASLGNSFYKHRISISSKGRGKSGGRVIVCQNKTGNGLPGFDI